MAVLYGKDLESYVLRRAKELGLNPWAVWAIAMEEGGFPSGKVLTGDNGTSFGPFQLHIGGALPSGKSAQWTQTPQGIDFVLKKMRSYKGSGGVVGFFTRYYVNFGRGANNPASIAKAASYYKSRSGSKVPTSTTSTASASKYAEFMKVLKGVFGTPYLWGGTTPAGFDCSGLVQWAYAQIGVSLPRVASDQAKASNTVTVKRGDIKPGDLLFYHNASDAKDFYHHVVIYIGGGKVIEAQQTGTKVGIHAMDPSFSLARRVMKNIPATRNRPPSKVALFSNQAEYQNAAMPSDPLGNPVGSVIEGIKTNFNILSAIGKADTWIRVLKILGGAAAVGGGVVLMTREIGVSVPSPVQGAVDLIPGVHQVTSAAKYVAAPSKIESTKVHANVEGTSTIKTTQYKSKRKGTVQEETYIQRHRNEPPVQRHLHTVRESGEKAPDTLGKKSRRAKRRTRAGWWATMEAERES